MDHYTDGELQLRIETSGVIYPNIGPTGSAANAYFDASNRILKSTSARKYKSNIEPAPQLAEIALEPVTFHHDADEQDYIGFIADDLADQDERIGDYNAEGIIENYDVRAVVAVLAAKVNDLTARVEALES